MKDMGNYIPKNPLKECKKCKKIGKWYSDLCGKCLGSQRTIKLRKSPIREWYGKNNDPTS